MKREKWLFPVLMILMIIVSSAANAQVRFGVKGGLNIASVKFSKDVLDADNVTGFHIGPTIEGMFGRGGAGIDLALLYSQKGFDSEMDKVKNGFIEIPANLKFKMGLPLVNPYFAAGPYVAFRVSGDKIWNVKNNTEGIIEQVKAQNFGAGLNFAAGAEIFNHLQVGLIYSVGLTDDYKTFEASNINSYTGKAHTWMISATLVF